MIRSVAAFVLLLSLPATASSLPWERERDLELRVLGGLVSFPGDASDLVTPGGQWGVAFAYQPFTPLGFELAYQGAVYRTEPALQGPQQTVFENGGQLAVKGGVEIGRWQPYALVGVGLAHLDVQEREGGTEAIRDGLLVLLPVGLGFDFGFPIGRAPVIGEVGPAVLVGVRATWAFLLRDDPFTASGNDGGADRLLLSATVGLAF